MTDAARSLKASDRARRKVIRCNVVGEHAFVSNGSRIYDLDEATGRRSSATPLVRQTVSRSCSSV